MRQPELPYDGDGWTYHTGIRTTVYRTRPLPDGHLDEERRRSFRWEPAGDLSDHLMGRSDPGEAWWEIPTSEARARVEEAKPLSRRNSPRAYIWS